jgi:hypothetical protein
MTLIATRFPVFLCTAALTTPNLPLPSGSYQMRVLSYLKLVIVQEVRIADDFPYEGDPLVAVVFGVGEVLFGLAALIDQREGPQIPVVDGFDRVFLHEAANQVVHRLVGGGAFRRIASRNEEETYNTARVCPHRPNSARPSFSWLPFASGSLPSSLSRPYGCSHRTAVD